MLDIRLKRVITEFTFYRWEKNFVGMGIAKFDRQLPGGSLTKSMLAELEFPGLERTSVFVGTTSGASRWRRTGREVAKVLAALRRALRFGVHVDNWSESISYALESLAHSQAVLGAWRLDYNETRIYSARGCLAPLRFLKRSKDAKPELLTN